MKPNLEDRFWSKVSKGAPEDCWEWNAGKGSAGYGKAWIEGRTMLAHRLSFELSNGPIPNGLVVRHRCDNRLCVNPAHLELGTHQDNSNDMKLRRRQAKGEAHGRCKLTPEYVIAIRTDERPNTVISKDYGISQGQVSHIKTGRRWGHLS